MIFLILLLLIFLTLQWAYTKKIFLGKILITIWLIIFLLPFSAIIISKIFSKKVLEKSDFYGEYIIDRNFFKGKQADWQYNHFRFEIKENDTILFYVTDEKQIIKTYKGKIFSPNYFNSARLGIKMQEPNHHILTSNPTIYREVWDFFLVFKSPKFHNMYFRKGKWKPIKNKREND
ncbi:MAG: hypothetical protein CR961_00795 [Polaribacter sp.]|nr:MAG: hypothetical protein CR961_00795 [Polaribacter sp.]